MGVKRAKVVLGVDEVRRLLGLPADVRIVGLHVRPDPDRVAVVLEGDGLPDLPSWPGAPTPAMMAARGHVEAPVMWHPVLGGHDAPPPTVLWEGWSPGDLVDSHPVVVDTAGADAVG